jgi:hypothetical protein
MSKRLKVLGITAALLLLILIGFFAAGAFRLRSGLLMSLPTPPEATPYVLMETRDGYFPKDLASALTDGPYAMIRKRSARGAILKIASLADRAALLIAGDEYSIAEVYGAVALSAKEAREIKKGKLPAQWSEAFKSPAISKDPEDGQLRFNADDLASPVFCAVTRGALVMAADAEHFARVAEVIRGDSNGLGGMKWKKEGKWPAHMEISDGGRFSSGEEKRDPIRIETAWRPFSVKKSGGPAGEAVWSVRGVSAKNRIALLLSSKAKAWDISKCVIPQPTLLSAGFNLPELKIPMDNWPFPLSYLGEWGLKMNLTEKQIREILKGQTIFSLGGYNRLLWFTLPGFMVEFTGDKRRMENLVEAFWDNMGFVARPKEVAGFEFGGSANIPFPVFGAGRKDMAVLGLISPESLTTGDKIKLFLRDGEKAVGWIIVDLARLGGALNDITKMSSLLQDDGEGTGFSGSDDGGFSYSSPALNEGVSDSLGHLLKKFGSALIVFETPLSGKMSWYDSALLNSK